MRKVKIETEIPDDNCIGCQFLKKFDWPNLITHYCRFFDQPLCSWTETTVSLGSAISKLVVPACIKCKEQFK